MTLVEDIVNWVKNQAVYLTGRGLVGLGMAFGGLASGPWALPIAVGATTALQAAITWRKEKRAERQLMNAYREEVAATLNMKPEDVTLEQLKEVANGNPEIEGDGNPVLRAALEKNSKKHLMQLVTSAMAGLITFGLGATVLASYGIDGDWLAEKRNIILESGGLSMLANATAAAGVLTIASTGMSLFNQIFDRIGERVLNIHKASAHDLIAGINRDIARGKVISQEQVFGVFVAAQPELAATIEADYGKAYDRLNPRQQYLALTEHGRGLPIRQLTFDINHFHIKPQELAFAAVGQESGVPPKHDVNFREAALKEKTTAELLEEVKKAALGDEGKKPDSAPQNPAAAIANDNIEGFAQRYAPRSADAGQQSFVERYAPERKNSPLERVLQELRKREEELSSVER